MGYRHIALKTDANFPMALPMLFIQIDVKVFFTSIIFGPAGNENIWILNRAQKNYINFPKVYVPDGMGDFMDALSDPRW